MDGMQEAVPRKVRSIDEYVALRLSRRLSRNDPYGNLAGLALSVSCSRWPLCTTSESVADSGGTDATRGAMFLTRSFLFETTAGLAANFGVAVTSSSTSTGSVVVLMSSLHLSSSSDFRRVPGLPPKLLSRSFNSGSLKASRSSTAEGTILVGQGHLTPTAAVTREEPHFLLLRQLHTATIIVAKTKKQSIQYKAIHEHFQKPF
jgi:hypothetical protein